MGKVIDDIKDLKRRHRSTYRSPTYSSGKSSNNYNSGSNNSGCLSAIGDVISEIVARLLGIIFMVAIFWILSLIFDGC